MIHELILYDGYSVFICKHCEKGVTLSIDPRPCPKCEGEMERVHPRKKEKNVEQKERG